MSETTPDQSRPYLDLSRVALPTQVKINDQDLDVASLSDQQKVILVDLARIDKEINDTEFSLRVLRSAKAELSRLFTSVSKNDGSANN